MKLPSLLSLALVVLWTAVPLLRAVNVKDFGAVGDGVADDTAAVMAAIAGAVDGVVEFPRGQYRLTRTVEITLAEQGTLGLVGRGGSARVVMAGPGPAFRFRGTHTGSALPASVQPGVWQRERMPLVESLEIVGAHPEADGIEFHQTLQPTIRGVLVREVRHGLHFTVRNRNVLIDSCHIYNVSGVGIFLDKVNIHQIIIDGSHISYCKGGGIGILRSEIRNFQATGNDIEYNYDLDAPSSADVWIDSRGGGTVREVAISGNNIQAVPSPGGANIRVLCTEDKANANGLISITGNHISNQTQNIHIEHARGISITGNTFVRGYDRHVVMAGGRNVVIGDNVFDSNPDYFRNLKVPCNGGVYVTRSQGVILSANLLDRVEYGSVEAGGAITIEDSRDVTLTGNQVSNPKVRGIHVLRSARVQVLNSLVTEDEGVSRLRASIELSGACPDTVVRGNSVSKGTAGDIVRAESRGVVVEDNLTVSALPDVR